jgi:hypothetical protein
MPPISSTSWEEIASPSPVPPYFLVTEALTWVKASNILSIFSGGIPIPESLTLKRRVTSSVPELGCS